MQYGRLGPTSRAACPVSTRAAAQRRQQRPSKPSGARYLVFFGFTLSAQRHKRGPKGRAHSHPRVPGRDLGLGRDFTIPPGPNLAQRDISRSGPSVSIRRLSMIFARIKAVAASFSPKTLTPFYPSLLSLCSRRARTAAAMVATGAGGEGPPPC